MKRLLPVLLLLASCRGCEEPPLVRAPVLARWREDARPVRLQLSQDLLPCQRAGMEAAVAWLEARNSSDLFAVWYVPPDALAVSGLPEYGTVGVSPGPTSAPNVLDDARITTLASDPRFIHSVSVTVTGCSVRAFTHELAHALGLGDIVEVNGQLMSKVHDGDAWALDDEDLRAVW